MMGDNPAPLSSNTTVLRSNVSPFPSTPFPSERDDNLRISAHCYNTVEDLDAVLAALQRHRKLLA